MKLTLKTSVQNGEPRAEGDAPTYVRKSPVVYLVYYLAISVGLGVAITAALLVIAVIEGAANEDPGYIRFLMASAGALSAIPCLIQVLSGPFVLTKDVVCRKCHTRLKVNRIAFFKSKYMPPVRCGCGGKIEPAFLWKLPG